MKGLFRDFLLCFQAPAVVSKKVYIPSALVALFHNVNVLIKALILLFTQISTVSLEKSPSVTTESAV